MLQGSLDKARRASLRRDRARLPRSPRGSHCDGVGCGYAPNPSRRRASHSAFQRLPWRKPLGLTRPAQPGCIGSYVRALLPRSIESSGRASDVALDGLPTSARAQVHFDLIGVMVLVDMRGNSGGTTDANASAKKAASGAVAVQAFQVGERWCHGLPSRRRGFACAAPAL
jgi:hypothetical protein